MLSAGEDTTHPKDTNTSSTEASSADSSHLASATTPTTPVTPAAEETSNVVLPPGTSGEDAPLLNAPPAGFAPPSFAKNTGLTQDPEADAGEPESTATDTFSEPNFSPNSQGSNTVGQQAGPQINMHHYDDPEISAATPHTAVDGLDSATPNDSSPKKSSLAGLTTGLLTQFSRLPKTFSGLGKAFKGKPLTLVAAGIIVVLLLTLGGGYFALSQSYQTQVDIWLNTQELSLTDTFVVGENVSSASESALQATTFTESVTLEEEVPTTGSKVIGDPATGRVKMINKTAQEKSFPAGTQITANSLTFTLDEDITIASASSQENDESRTISFGTGEVGVTAVDIGPEGNLGEDTTFTVANFDSSSYEAKNDAAFSGGSSREIQAVSQADIDDTADRLSEAGKTQLVEKIEGSAEDGQYVFFTDEVEITDIAPSVEVGEEAKFVTVKVTVEGQALRIAEDDLQATAQQLLSDQVQADQTLLPESVDLEPKSVAIRGEGVYTLEAEISGQGVPTVQASAILEKIAGAYTSRAEQILSGDTRIERFTITSKPTWIGWLFNRLPKDTDRIPVNIRIDKSQ
ncbi:baseplate J/gp47 family protein [Candidatus Woesebacteria bacterium]|nr:baseplate J/gp47 family protein [Candidatus Woesebacteria bacterium]